MTSKLPKVSQIPTLASSISDLRDVLLAVEEIEDMGTAATTEQIDVALQSLVPAWDTAVSHFQSAIDRRISLLDYAELLDKKLSTDIAALQAKKKVVATISDRVKEQTKIFMEENPSLDFRGSIKSFAIQKNGGVQPIEYDVSLQSVANVVDPTDVQHFPAGYLREQRIFVLNREKFEGDIRSGVLDGAMVAKLLPRGTHLRRR